MLRTGFGKRRRAAAMGNVDRDLLMSMLGLGCASDWLAVFTLFAVALTYFLAPVVGYGPERRGSLSAALYLMLTYVGLSVLQFGVLFLSMLDGGGGRGPDELSRLAMFAFAVLKLVFFFLALLLYVLGLHSLRLARRPDGRRDDWDEGMRYGEPR
jgi:hypothetical protein